MHISPAMPRRGARAALPVAVAITVLCALCGSLVSVVAADANFGPQVSVDRNVAERGVTLNVSLNGFPANQHLAVFIRPAALLNTGPDVLTVPVDVDANGSGTTAVPTAGLADGTYIVGVTGDAAIVPAVYQPAAFGVTEPGILGPRAVRFYPMPSDERDG